MRFSHSNHEPIVAAATVAEPPSFAFAFDIDGVLLHQAKPIPGAAEALAYLHERNIPFILLTNGGGKHEKERVAELNKKLDPKLTLANFVQSHTPYQDLVKGPGGLEDKTVLVTGGDPQKCREIAEEYGFKNVITPADIVLSQPKVWPFSSPMDMHNAKPLPVAVLTPASSTTSLSSSSSSDSSSSSSPPLKVDAIFVFNDPRDWALDSQIIVDLLLSQDGVVGTLSAKNGDPALPNAGWQMDGQPPLYFSHGDMFWSTGYHLPRLAQGGFVAAVAGLWRDITGGAELRKTMMGKPTAETYRYAEQVLTRHRDAMLMGHHRHHHAHHHTHGKVKTDPSAPASPPPLKTVYMIGDNPDSDIRGANEWASPRGTEWCSVLVRTGVWQANHKGQGSSRIGPRSQPRAIVDDVRAAVEWALKREGEFWGDK